MPNFIPIKQYIAAQEAHRKGDDKSAATLLANSLGAEKPTPILEDSLDQLLKNDSLANDVILTIISTEVSKNARRH